MKFIKTLKKENIKIEEEKLRKILKRHRVKLAYLFGSYAQGKNTEYSDIDIAVLFEKETEKNLDTLRVELIEQLKKEAIDLVDLEKAPPKLQYKIIKHGKIILGKKHASEFETKAMKKYFDFKPLEEQYFQKMEERIKKGEYGRPRQD